MPVEYHVDGGVIVVKMFGEVTSAEFARFQDATDNDPELGHDLPRLVLIDEAARFPSSPEIIQHAGRTAHRARPRFGPRTRFACVATSPLGIGIANMFMGNAGLGDRYQVFSDEQAARAWLADSP